MRLFLPTIFAAAWLLAGLAACSRHSGVAGEVVVLDERLTLVRGKTNDAVRRELISPVDGTCVAIVEEDDADLIVELQSAAPGAHPAKAEVNSSLAGEGIEVAVVPVARGAKISIQLSMALDRLTPAQAPTRIACYGDAEQTPEVQARVAAYRAWSEATQRGSTSEEATKHRQELLDIAIARLESPGGDARMAAWARLEKGTILTDTMTDRHAALTELRLAERAFAALQNPEPRKLALARYHLGDAVAQLMHDGKSTNPTPEEATIEARKIFTELSADSSPLSPAEKARAIKYLGVICYHLSDYACATRHFEAAAAAAHKAGYRPEEISALNNLAATALNSGDTAGAVRYFERVLPLVDKVYSPADYMTYHYNAGVAYTDLGDTSKAITNLLLALEVARERQSPLDLGNAMYGLGYAYSQRGDMQQAETFFVESLKQLRIASEGAALVSALAMVGRFARMDGRVDEALALHREALALAAIPDSKMSVHYEMALDFAARGDFVHAIEISRLGLQEAAGGNAIHRAQMQLELARDLVESQPNAAALAEAKQLAHTVLQFALARSDTVHEVGARQVQGRVLVAQGNYAAARREYEAAIAVILDVRGTTASPELQAAALDHEQDTFREYVDLLMRPAAARGPDRFAPVSHDEEAALRVLELARSSSTSLARNPRLDAATQARVNELLQQIAAKRVRLAALNDRAKPDGEAVGALQLEMSQLRAEVDRLRGGSVGDTRSTKLPESINRPWPPVAAGVTQLSYALGTRNAYLWERDSHGLRVAVLAQSPARLERAYATLGEIDKIRSPARLEQSFAELSASLLPRGTLDNASASLEVVAEGGLGTLPFAALRAPGDGKRLVETHDVRMITSMFDEGAPASSAPRRMAFVGVAGITGEQRSAGHVFSSLGAARAEARAIAELFSIGNDASRVKLLTIADGDADAVRTLWAGGADAVHFATHGLANLRYPSASLLLLPKGGGGDSAYLTAGQVQEWHGDAGVVFLAACETAAGPARFAEGMSGLPRSFLVAGAHGVVATLWPVEDIYESEFTVEFYRRFIVGRDAERALAETQRAWLKPRPGETEGDHQQRLATAWAHVFNARPKSP